jgi:hypothetical protein
MIESLFNHEAILCLQSNPAIILTSITTLIAVVGAFIAIISSPSKFKIFVNPIYGDIPPGGSMEIAITIRVEKIPHWLYNYKNNISLSEIIIPDSDRIMVTFNPSRFQSPISRFGKNRRSKVMINVDKNVEIRDYNLRIQGVSGSIVESCEFDLYIIAPREKTIQTPSPPSSPKPTTINVYV